MSRLGNVGGRLYRGEVSIDFVGRKRTWYSISGAILLISIAALLFHGLDFSVDFKGGSVFQFPASSASTTQVQSAVTDAGVTGAVVQELSGSLGTSWQVQTPALSAARRASPAVHRPGPSCTPEISSAMSSDTISGSSATRGRR